MEDITTKTVHELEEDLQDSKKDIDICDAALAGGINTYSGGSVRSRRRDNLRFVEVISKELERRRNPKPCPHFMGLGHQCYMVIGGDLICQKQPCKIIIQPPQPEDDLQKHTEFECPHCGMTGDDPHQTCCSHCGKQL